MKVGNICGFERLPGKKRRFCSQSLVYEGKIGGFLYFFLFVFLSLFSVIFRGVRKFFSFYAFASLSVFLGVVLSLW